uniref:Uncharacterized protein n=1 Tax=Plectus sambesii TaxID=2011161 RepID=A0A914VFR9_9BILA
MTMSSKPPSKVEPIASWLHWSRMEALNHIVESHTFFGRCFWSICCLLSIFMFCYQSYFIVQAFYRYEKSTVITLTNAHKQDFPAVTICNLNPFKKSKIGESKDLNALMSAYEYVTQQKKSEDVVFVNKRSKRQANATATQCDITTSNVTGTMASGTAESVVCGDTLDVSVTACATPVELGTGNFTAYSGCSAQYADVAKVVWETFFNCMVGDFCGYHDNGTDYAARNSYDDCVISYDYCGMYDVPSRISLMSDCSYAPAAVDLLCTQLTITATTMSDPTSVTTATPASSCSYSTSTATFDGQQADFAATRCPDDDTLSVCLHLTCNGADNYICVTATTADNENDIATFLLQCAAPQMCLANFCVDSTCDLTTNLAQYCPPNITCTTTTMTTEESSTSTLPSSSTTDTETTTDEATSTSSTEASSTTIQETSSSTLPSSSTTDMETTTDEPTSTSSTDATSTTIQETSSSTLPSSSTTDMETTTDEPTSSTEASSTTIEETSSSTLPSSSSSTEITTEITTEIPTSTSSTDATSTTTRDISSTTNSTLSTSDEQTSTTVTNEITTSVSQSNSPSITNSSTTASEATSLPTESSSTLATSTLPITTDTPTTTSTSTSMSTTTLTTTVPSTSFSDPTTTPETTTSLSTTTSSPAETSSSSSTTTPMTTITTTSAASSSISTMNSITSTIVPTTSTITSVPTPTPPKPTTPNHPGSPSPPTPNPPSPPSPPTPIPPTPVLVNVDLLKFDDSNFNIYFYIDYFCSSRLNNATCGTKYRNFNNKSSGFKLQLKLWHQPEFDNKHNKFCVNTYCCYACFCINVCNFGITTVKLIFLDRDSGFHRSNGHFNIVTFSNVIKYRCSVIKYSANQHYNNNSTIRQYTTSRIISHDKQRNQQRRNHSRKSLQYGTNDVNKRGFGEIYVVNICRWEENWHSPTWFNHYIA